MPQCSIESKRVTEINEEVLPQEGAYVYTQSFQTLDEKHVSKYSPGEPKRIPEAASTFTPQEMPFAASLRMVQDLEKRGERVCAAAVDNNPSRISAYEWVVDNNGEPEAYVYVEKPRYEKCMTEFRVVGLNMALTAGIGHGDEVESFYNDLQESLPVGTMSECSFLEFVKNYQDPFFGRLLDQQGTCSDKLESTGQTEK